MIAGLEEPTPGRTAGAKARLNSGAVTAPFEAAPPIRIRVAVSG